MTPATRHSLEGLDARRPTTEALQQVVVNICDNAAQPMAGGTVAFGVAERTVAGARRLGHGDSGPAATR